MSYLNDKNPVVLMKTSEGDMEVQLFPEVAPITVKNFIKLVEEGFYKDILFHRVIPGFVIQGGDPTGSGSGGSSINIKGEFTNNGVKNDLRHTRGVISMARSASPDSASSQIFICHTEVPQLDNNYAGFGMVTKGIDVVDKIATAKTDDQDRPREPKIWISAEVLKK